AKRQRDGRLLQDRLAANSCGPGARGRRHANSHAYSQPDANGNCDSQLDANTYSNGYIYAYTYSNGNIHPDCNCDCDGNGNSHGNRNTHGNTSIWHTYATAYANTTDWSITKNSSDSAAETLIESDQLPGELSVTIYGAADV